MQTNDNVTLLY